jgi:ABC-type Fe3+/spermidine/putrescine transport system ATPase subunit
MPAINLRNISKYFGSTHALDDVTFDVKDGEYLCILGSTGSGKTTLLRTISGIIKPNQGEIIFDGKKINDIPAEERNAVYVPQTYALFPHLKVIDNVCFGPISRGVNAESAKRKAMEVLSLVRLEKRAESYPGELSGGMQQRVALARGLASGARLLLLDEPLGALDARLRLELRTELKKLAKDNGFTVIHVTHDQDEAMSIGDRIMILRRGKMQQIGTPYHVYHRPENIFVANFIGHTNFLEGVVMKRNSKGSTIRLRGDTRVTIEDVSHIAEEAEIIAVREEKTQIFDHPVEAPNAISGDVSEAHFMGTFVRYEVRLDNGDHIAALRPSDLGLERLQIGDRVMITFEPNNTSVFDYPTLGLKRELEAY